MTCFRKGGCGPYEMFSCSECPASKESYLERYYKNAETVKKNIESTWPDYKIDLANSELLVSKHSVKLHK